MVLEELVGRLGWVCVLAHTWEGADECLATVVGVDTALLLVVLHGLVPQQPDELDHALQELARRAAGWREDHDLAFHGEGQTGSKDANAESNTREGAVVSLAILNRRY